MFFFEIKQNSKFVFFISCVGNTYNIIAKNVMLDVSERCMLCILMCLNNIFIFKVLLFYVEIHNNPMEFQILFVCFHVKSSNRTPNMWN